MIAPGAGDWRPLAPAATDPDAWVGNAKPFLIESPEQFRSDGPNALKSGLHEGLQRGEGARGARQHEAHRGRDGRRGLLAVPADRALEPLARSLAGSLDTADQARLYAMVNLAAADGAISCWNDKYYWNFWRPLRRDPGG